MQLLLRQVILTNFLHTLTLKLRGQYASVNSQYYMRRAQPHPSSKLGPGGRRRTGINYHHYAYDDTDFVEPLTARCYIVLTLVLVCGALNIARAWHIATHVGDNFWDDLEHLAIFIFASVLCVLQGRLVLVPMDCIMRYIGRQELNFCSLVSILLCHICVADHRHFYASLFHAVSGISIASVIHSRHVNVKSSRERA